MKSKTVVCRVPARVLSLGFVPGSLQNFTDFISRMYFEQRTVKDQSRHSIGTECCVDWIHGMILAYQINNFCSLPLQTKSKK